MGSNKLKEDLSNCLINFDRRVLITELLDDYKVPYEEVNNVLVDYLTEQENKQKLKYEKHYVVHGLQEGDNKKEIFKVVEEQKLNEWLNKLKNSESSLYSVEVAGGAKSAAPVFKPMSVEEGVKLKKQSTKTTNGAAPSATTVAVDKKEIKPKPEKIVVENNTSKTNKETAKPSKKSSPKTENSTKKSPKIEISPTETKKSKEKSAASKKGISNFFGPAPSTKKSEDTKLAAVAKPPTPKKMQDFFKKQAEKPKSSTESLKKPAVNTSVQLFADEEPEDVASSDEEEKLEALKRDIISSDVEMGGGDDDEDIETKPTTTKRRRILDSDDEEDDTPTVKHEKLDIKEPKEEVIDVEGSAAPQQDETYLDEDGFVITKKAKQKAQSSISKKTLKSPPVTMKASPKGSKKKSPSSAKDSKSSANPAAKTKQAGIMNFFTKK